MNVNVVQQFHIHTLDYKMQINIPNEEIFVCTRNDHITTATKAKTKN